MVLLPLLLLLLMLLLLMLLHPFPRKGCMGPRWDTHKSAAKWSVLRL